MQQAGRPSWRAALDDNPSLLHIALYVRDACGLSGPPDSLNPPALDAEVADHSEVLPLGTRTAAGREWFWWWRELVSSEGAALRGPADPVPWAERQAARAAVVEQLLDWPELHVLAPRPLLQAVVRAAFDDAVKWRAAHQQELAAERRSRVRTPGPLRELADRLGRRHATTPGNLRVGVFVLGVRGSWSHLAAPGVLLCSPAVAADDAHFARLVEAAFRAGR